MWLVVFNGTDSRTTIVELSKHYVNQLAHLFMYGCMDPLVHVDQQWSVGRVMGRDMISNSIEYKKRLAEGKMKGVLADRRSSRIEADQTYEIRQVQQQQVRTCSKKGTTKITRLYTVTDH